MTVSLAGLTLHVADVDRSLQFYRRLPGAAAADLRALGFEVDGPTERRWGERDVLAQDPDGNLLEFAAPRRGAE